MNPQSEAYILPFLAKKRPQEVGLIVKTRQPDESPDQEENPNAAMEACASDLISAIHAHDMKAAAEALKAAFDCYESEPHEEAEHVEPHSYQASKED